MLQRLSSLRRSALPRATALSPRFAFRSFPASPAPPMAAFSSSSSLVAPHFFDQVLAHGDRPALIDRDANASWSYTQLLTQALQLADSIRQATPATDGPAPRVAYLGTRGPSYVVMQWATWLAGGVAVPLHAAHPLEELQYIVDDSDAAVLMVSEDLLPTLQDRPSSIQALVHGLQTEGKRAVLKVAKPSMMSTGADSDAEEAAVREWLSTCAFDRTGAHIVYTSGTTGRPKGVVTTHAGLTAQIHDVVSAWEMTHNDHLLHFLPLHHVHGILNNLLCVHYAGGSVEFIPSAKPSVIWPKLAEASTKERKVTMLMAVPTVYMNLLEDIEHHQHEAEAQAPYDVKAAIDSARGLRVAISGSMACPVSILSRWESLTGLRLLERYGMTELGMALTNPLRGERHLGYVGRPFPSVSVRLVDPETESEIDIKTEEEGELRVKGPSVFKEYWRKPEATAKEFDVDGWFKTGDVVQYSVEKDSFRIRGRASADIIKSGGYKISALDIERVVLTHPQVLECAVFGIADEKWGQIVSAVLRTRDGKDVQTLTPPLPGFLKEHLADYRVPRKYFVVDEIPKNAMGKVNKKALAMIYGAPKP